MSVAETLTRFHATADIFSAVATILPFGWLILGLERISSGRGQVALGVWLVLLGWWASESGEDAGEPVGDGSGDRVSVP